jgi:nucleoside-diphosphate-sugar epimerase
MRILVTGHKGFVGRYFYNELLCRGHSVKGIDVVDGNSCEYFFNNDNEVFDYVFNFACYIEPTIGIKSIKKSNISYDICLDSILFSWAIRTGQKNIIYFSSSSVYPISLQNNPEYRLKESDVDCNFEVLRKPDNIYGWTKLTGEFFLKYMRENGINSFIFRPFSIYGEDQNNSFIFKVLLDSVYRRDDTIYIWGDGNQTRDFIYIKDVVNSVLKIVENGYETPMNIGTGIATSINDLLEIMLKEANWRPSNIVHLLDKKVGEKHRCADVTMLNKVYKIQHTIQSVVREYL